MQKLHVKEPIEGLPLPTIEDGGNLVLSYFDVFDDVFKTELKNAIQIARAKPQKSIQQVHLQQMEARVDKDFESNIKDQGDLMHVIKLYDISKQADLQKVSEELIKGRYNFKFPAHMTSLSVKLSKLCKQSSAFQMYKRGDMMKKIEDQG